MSNYVEVICIVEGRSEQIFIEEILAPYLALKNVFLTATQLSKPGQNKSGIKTGGDVRFSRAIKDIGNHLKQRKDTYVCTFVDYYGIKEWPGVKELPNNLTVPNQIAQYVNEATCIAVVETYADLQVPRRYIPYFAVHEFEALLFSDATVLAGALQIEPEKVQQVLNECGEPEAINNSPHTAPSKRLDNWCRGKFKKTITGIAIAKAISIPVIRKKCPVFNTWLVQLEGLVANP